MLIGFTGERGVGKSEVGKVLVARGFNRIHPFNGGKAATKAYFIHLGATPDEAERMVNGDLKDKPSSYLPGNATPRFFMEKFGKFMGTVLGFEWTLGKEHELNQRAYPDADCFAESIVYEAPLLRELGGFVVRVTRPGHVGPKGCETDEAQAAIEVDATLVNDSDLIALEFKVEELLRHLRATNDGEYGKC